MAARDRSSLRILFVGDDPSLVESALDGAAISETATVVDAVPDASTLRDRHADDGVDCVVTDGTGSAAGDGDLSTFRAEMPDVPLVAIVDDEPAIHGALAAGADEYLLRSVATERPSLVAERLRSAVETWGNLDPPGTRAWYEAILEHSMDAITVLDPMGTVTYQSPSVESLLGYDPADLVGEEALEYVHPTDRDRVERTFEQFFAGERTTTGAIEYRFRDAEGSWVWIESVVTARPGTTVGGFVVNSRLIEERKRHEQEADRYRTLLEVVPDTILITDLEGNHVEIYGFEDWTGYDREDLVGNHVSKTTPQEDIERAESAIRELLRDEDRDKATYEHRIVTADDDVIRCETQVTPLPPDDDGAIPGFMHAIRDVSDRKERERRLEQAETVFQNARNGVFLVDVTSEGRFEFQRSNDAYESITGFSEETIRGKTPREYIPDTELGAEIEGDMAEVVETGSPHHDEKAIEMSHGVVDLEASLAPVVVDDEVDTIVGIIRDITERKERRRDLQLKNRAIDEAPIGILVVDATGESARLEYVNDGFVDLTGYGPSTIREAGWSVLEGRETDADVFAQFERAVENEEPMSDEVLVYRTDGQPRWFKVSLSPIRDEDQEVTHFVAFQQDITELKEYETEIERRFDEFADVLADDLRTPLEEARASLTAARENGDPDALESAEEWLRRVDDLVEDLATVHSFSVPSRDHSESALGDASGET